MISQKKAMIPGLCRGRDEIYPDAIETRVQATQAKHNPTPYAT